METKGATTSLELVSASNQKAKKLTIPLVPETWDKTCKLAHASNSTPEQISRKLLVIAVENPDRAELISDVYETQINTELILNKLQSLRQELTGSKSSVAATFELILTGFTDESPEQLRQFIHTAFGLKAKGDGDED